MNAVTLAGSDECTGFAVKRNVEKLRFFDAGCGCCAASQDTKDRAESIAALQAFIKFREEQIANAQTLLATLQGEPAEQKRFANMLANIRGEFVSGRDLGDETP